MLNDGKFSPQLNKNELEFQASLDVNVQERLKGGLCQTAAKQKTVLANK